MLDVQRFLWPVYYIVRLITYTGPLSYILGCNYQPCSSSLPSITQLLASISSGSGAREVPTVPNPQVSLGYGIPSIPPKTQDHILAREYIDFRDLPPAKGKTSPLSLPASEGNIIMVNAFDLMQQKKLIPDIGTWVQCFTIFAGVICFQSPGRLRVIPCQINTKNT